MTHLPSKTSVDPTPRRSYGVVVSVLLTLIISLAAFVRLYAIGSAPLWIDEFLTLEILNGYGQVHQRLVRDELILAPPALTVPASQGPWQGIWSSSGGDTHPPLYYHALRLWRDWTGNSETALRTLSVICSLAAVLLTFAIVRGHFGTSAALWAALLMAVASSQIRYAQEARGYAMAQLFMLLAIWSSTRIARDPPAWRWAGVLALSTLATLFTNYLAVLPLIALGLWTLFYERGLARRVTVGVLLATALIFGLLWIPMLVEQYRYKVVETWLTTDPSDHISLTFWRFFALPIQLLGRTTSDSRAYAAGAAVVFVLPILLFRKNPCLLFYTLWLMAGTVPILLIDLISNRTHLLVTRYFLSVSPAVCVLMAGLLSYRSGMIKHLLPACASLYAVLSIQQAYVNREADWRRFAVTMHAESSPGQVVAFASDPGSGWADVVYVGCSHYIGQFPGPVLLLSRPPGPTLLSDLERRGPMWIVLDSTEPLIPALFPAWTIRQSHLLTGVGMLHEITPPVISVKD